MRISGNDKSKIHEIIYINTDVLIELGIRMTINLLTALKPRMNIPKLKKNTK